MLREDIEAVDKIELFKLVSLGPTTLAWGRIKKELSELAQLSHNSAMDAIALVRHLHRQYGEPWVGMSFEQCLDYIGQQHQ